jgi:hypothetical protein
MVSSSIHGARKRKRIIRRAGEQAREAEQMPILFTPRQGCQYDTFEQLIVLLHRVEGKRRGAKYDFIYTVKVGTDRVKFPAKKLWHS